jgi:hypothetical protein
MSDERDEDFLSRWSRRKHAAAVEPQPAEREPAPAPTKPDRTKRGRTKPSSEAVEPDGAAQKFDPASLPPLDAITATTNVADFLRKEVPLELSRAALRRAWTADPLIRDFVGLAENAWDFNDPDAIPGFGALDYSPQQLKDLLAQVMGESRPANEPDADAQEGRPGSTPTDDSQAARHTSQLESPSADSETQQTPMTAAPADEQADETQSSALPASRSAAGDIASRHDASADNSEKQVERTETKDETRIVQRTHGGALPR